MVSQRNDPRAHRRARPPRIVVVGGGVGGLSVALALHAVGHSAVVAEQASSIRELGVSINILPPAVAVLSKLGLLDELLATGVATRELRLCARDGTLVQVSPRRALVAQCRHLERSVGGIGQMLEWAGVPPAKSSRQRR